MSVTVRTPRPGDGAGMARVWLSAAAYYAGLDSEYFQVPPSTRRCGIGAAALTLTGAT